MRWSYPFCLRVGLALIIDYTRIIPEIYQNVKGFPASAENSWKRSFPQNSGLAAPGHKKRERRGSLSWALAACHIALHRPSVDATHIALHLLRVGLWGVCVYLSKNALGVQRLLLGVDR